MGLSYLCNLSVILQLAMRAATYGLCLCVLWFLWLALELQLTHLLIQFNQLRPLELEGLSGY